MTSFAVIGPGRVGSALARRWHEHGYRLLGFVGRDAQHVARARAFCGAGDALTLADLGTATFVLVSVGDDDLASVVAAAARQHAPRRCALWLHASGRHDLDVLAPLRGLGARVGSLHPLCPFADADAGYRAMPGKPAVLQGDARSLRLLSVLARSAGLRPVTMPGQDRVLYHAACALAANGLTALFDLVERLFMQSCSIDARAADELCSALMRGALDACAERGAAGALSGPVLRGDAATLAAHRAALAGAGATAAATYRALLQGAVDLAHRAGHIDDALRSRLAKELADG